MIFYVNTRQRNLSKAIIGAPEAKSQTLHIWI